MKEPLAHHYPGILLFLFFCCLSLFVFKDYGVSWDEPDQTTLGTLTYNYIVKGDTALFHCEIKDYGSGYELPLVILEKSLGARDSRDIYLVRHLATHLFFLFSAFCGYMLAYRLFHKRWLAFLAFLLLVMHPRIYAHSYFNTKDIPFLSMFMISLLACQVAFEKNTSFWYIVLGVVCGYTTSIRIMGIMLVAILCCFFVVDIIRSAINKKQSSKTIKNFIFYALAFMLSLYTFWPILWKSPLHSFKESYIHLSRYISGGGMLLFMGAPQYGAKLPWTYVPVWFSVTMPLLWLLVGIIGALLLTYKFLRNPFQNLANTKDRNFYLYLACFIVPVISVISMHSVLYDDWRHLYFIYPSFVMLAIYVIDLLTRTKMRKVIVTLCIAQITYLAFFMIKFHPYQQVYFSYIVPHNKEYLRANYELDYWGSCYKQGLEYLLRHDTSSIIRICNSMTPIERNLSIIPAKDRKRIELVGEDQHPDYFMTNFRYHPEDFNYPGIFYEIKVLNSTILRVYKTH